MSTLTLADQRRAVSEVNQARYEGYIDYESREKARRLLDEETDQAERLSAPMEAEFEYDLTDEGLRSQFGELLLTVFEEGHAVAVHNAKTDKNWEFEAEQRGIEVMEQRGHEAFARAHGVGVRITSQTLDKSNYAGMQAIAQRLGHALPDERPSSTDILRTRMHMGVPPAIIILSPIPDAIREGKSGLKGYRKDRELMMVRIVTPRSVPRDEHLLLKDLVRNTYDNALTEQFGGQWFAGRPPMTIRDALEFIRDPAQADLLLDHMDVVNGVFAATNDKQERMRRLEPHRYNLAAALDDRLHGRQVESLSSAGDNARAEGRDYDGYCPTSEATTASAQMERLGFSVEPRESILKCVNCPYCKKVVDAVKKNTAQEKSIQCLNKSCNKKVNLRTGEVMAGTSPSKEVGKAATKALVKVIPPPEKNVVRREALTIGGVKVEYIDLAASKRAKVGAAR